jgi:hypothetical protein
VRRMGVGKGESEKDISKKGRRGRRMGVGKRK